MYSLKSGEQFLLQIRRLDERLKNLKLNGIEIDRETASIKYNFICDETVDKELEEKILKVCFDNSLAVFKGVEISIKKIVSNEELVIKCIFDFLKENYPSISIFLKPTDVYTVIIDNVVKYTLKLTPDGAEYVNKNGALKKLNEHLSKNFCSEFAGSTVIKEREEIIDLSSEEVFEAELKRVEHRTIRVKEIEIIDDANIGNLALYIEDALDGDATICGKVTEVTEKQTKNGKPFLIIHIDDTTGKTSGVYFSKKNTYSKIKEIKEGDAIIARVKIGEYNGKRSTTFEKINKCIFPEDFVKKEKFKKKAPQNYSTIFPEEISFVRVKSIFDEEGRLPKEILENDVVVFDIETTGLDVLNDGITEIGAVKIKGGEIKEKWTTLVKPDQVITSKITELTGITNEMVANSPKISTVIPDFMKFIDGCIIVAQNAEFDTKFIKKYAGAEEYEVKNKVYDTMELSRQYLRLNKNDLHTLAEHYGIVFNHHRAYDDALATAQIFLELMKVKAEKENC